MLELEAKQRQYAVLVVERKQCRLCVGLRNPADTGFAEHDSDEIGPWTRLHGDLNAELMVIGQDWAAQLEPLRRGAASAAC